MRTMLILALLVPSLISSAQILNGDFETGGLPDLSHWEYSCGANSYPDSPSGSGRYCVMLNCGNFKSCFPSYLYQKIPTISDGQSFTLSAWARAEEIYLPVGIYFGSINNGVITVGKGIETGSIDWRKLSVQGSYTLSHFDTAVVILGVETLGGQFQGAGYFDQIYLFEGPLGVNQLEEPQRISFFPVPFNNQTTMETKLPMKNGTMILHSTQGKEVQRNENLHGSTFTVLRTGLSAGLYLVTLNEGEDLVARERLIVVN